MNRAPSSALDELDALAIPARPLFVLGNKRSGTSQLVRLLNLHPRVFVAHESDAAWILYQFHHGLPVRGHEWDSERGLRSTLERCGDLLRRERTPWENFQAVQLCVMRHGGPWLPPMRKSGLRWIGDKKPFQHTDPRVLGFLLEEFPEARFLHIVRHPLAVVASSDRFNETRDGDFWLGMSREEKLERWAFHETQVETLRARVGSRVHSLRFEDLCRHPGRELAAALGFLELEADASLRAEAARTTRPAANVRRPVRCSADVRHIAAVHGYDLERPFARLRASAEQWRAWALRRRKR